MAASVLYRRARPAHVAVTPWRADDGTMLRSFRWPSELDVPRGSLLFQTGRGDFFEKYLELFAHWHGRGWNLTGFDWRGQGGSARSGTHARTGHVDRFEEYVSELVGFARSWTAEAAAPRVMVGHSMGGHLLLRAMVEGHVRPDAAVLVAPMLGLQSPFGQRLGGLVARLMAGLGAPGRPAWRAGETPLARAERALLLTADEARYADEQWWYEANPELHTGPPSWRWLAEAFGSTAALARDPRLATLDVPILALVADADRLVDAAVARRVLARLPNVTVVRFGSEARHELLREADPVRNRVIAKIDEFLAAHAP